MSNLIKVDIIANAKNPNAKRIIVNATTQESHVGPIVNVMDAKTVRNIKILLKNHFIKKKIICCCKIYEMIFYNVFYYISQSLNL